MVSDVVLIRKSGVWWTETVVQQNAVSVLKRGWSWRVWCSQIWAITECLWEPYCWRMLWHQMQQRKFSWKKIFSSLLYSFSILSMLSCNPSVFCMASADYSTYQRTQDSICRISLSFFDGYIANVVVKSFESILLSFHTHYKNLLNELPFFIVL